MKATQKRRERRAPDISARTVRGSIRMKGHGLRSPAALMTGTGAALAAVWFCATLWKPSTELNVGGKENVSIGSGSKVPQTVSPAKSREGNNQEQFVAKVTRGNALLAQGKPAEAVQVLTEAMHLNPSDEDIHYDLGLAFARLGKFEEAIQQYGEALRIFPNYVEAHNNLGNVLMRTGKIDEAIAHFETAVKLKPDYPSAHNNLGTALQRIGWTNESLSHFQQAAKLMPDYWEAHFNIATSLLQEGKFDDSRAELETVLRLKPDFQPAKDALAQLKSLRPTSAPEHAN